MASSQAARATRSRPAEIDELGAFSVHPDQGELIDWLGTAASPLEAVHLVHGEPDAASALGSLIAQRDQHAVVARAGERIRLDAFSG